MVQLHDPGRRAWEPCLAVFSGIPAQDGMDPAVAVGGHVGDDGLDIYPQLPSRE